MTIACRWKRVQIDLNERYGRKLLPVGREVCHLLGEDECWSIIHPIARMHSSIQGLVACLTRTSSETQACLRNCEAWSELQSSSPRERFPRNSSSTHYFIAGVLTGFHWIALRCIAVEKRKGVVMGPAEVWARVGPGLAGAVFGGGWWFWVDAAVCSSMTVPFLHYIPGHTIFSPPSPPLQLRFLVPIEEDDCIVWKL